MNISHWLKTLRLLSRLLLPLLLVPSAMSSSSAGAPRKPKKKYETTDVRLRKEYKFVINDIPVKYNTESWDGKGDVRGR